MTSWWLSDLLGTATLMLASAWAGSRVPLWQVAVVLAIGVFIEIVARTVGLSVTMTWPGP